jgi:hypothetical protein
MGFISTFVAASDFILSKMTTEEVRLKFFANFSPDTFKTLLELDPTYDSDSGYMGEFGRYLLDRAKALGYAVVLRDADDWKQALVEFITLRKSKAIKADLLSFKTLDQLTAALMLAQKESFDIVFQDASWLIVRTKTHKANMFFGCGTDWCTVNTSGYYWGEYAPRGPIIQCLKGATLANPQSIKDVGIEDRYQVFARTDKTNLEIENGRKKQLTYEELQSALGETAFDALSGFFLPLVNAHQWEHLQYNDRTPYVMTEYGTEERDDNEYDDDYDDDEGQTWFHAGAEPGRLAFSRGSIGYGEMESSIIQVENAQGSFDALLASLDLEPQEWAELGLFPFILQTLINSGGAGDRLTDSLLVAYSEIEADDEQHIELSGFPLVNEYDSFLWRRPFEGNTSPSDYSFCEDHLDLEDSIVYADPQGVVFLARLSGELERLSHDGQLARFLQGHDYTSFLPRYDIRALLQYLSTYFGVELNPDDIPTGNAMLNEGEAAGEYLKKRLDVSISYRVVMADVVYPQTVSKAPFVIHAADVLMVSSFLGKKSSSPVARLSVRTTPVYRDYETVGFMAVSTLLDFNGRAVSLAEDKVAAYLADLLKDFNGFTALPTSQQTLAAALKNNGFTETSIQEELGPGTSVAEHLSRHSLYLKYVGVPDNSPELFNAEAESLENAALAVLPFTDSPIGDYQISGPRNGEFDEVARLFGVYLNTLKVFIGRLIKDGEEKEGQILPLLQSHDVPNSLTVWYWRWEGTGYPASSATYSQPNPDASVSIQYTALPAS